MIVNSGSAGSDVVIVGAGVVGLSVAYELLRRGARVAVIGPQPHPEDGAGSRAAGAMLSLFSEVEPSHHPDRVAADVRERLAASRLWEIWLSRLAEETGRQIRTTHGTWVISRPNESVALDAIAAAARQHAHVAEVHRGVEVPGLSATHHIAAGLWLPSEDAVDSADLVDALSEAVREHPGARWHEDSAISVSARKRSVAVSCANGPVTADRAVLAVGVATAGLLPESGRTLDVPVIIGGHGSGLLLRAQDPPAHTIRTPNRAFSCGVHLVPRGGGLTYVGATNRMLHPSAPGRGARTSLDEIAVLVHSVTSEIDHRLFEAELVDVRAGRRSYTLDRLPLVGASADPRILLATATYRSGFALAPRVAELIADEMETPGAHSDHPYRVGRTMPPGTLESILGHTSQAIAAACEPLGYLPPGIQERLAGLLDLTLRMALADPADDVPQRQAIRELWANVPIEEALPSILRLAGPPNTLD